MRGRGDPSVSRAAGDGNGSAYDTVARTYQAARPTYPDEIFRAIESFGAFASPPRVLEVGSGTGQATRQMVALGWRVEAIEPGEQMVAVAQRAAQPEAGRIRNARFEDAVVEPAAFDVVVAATSWHWVDPVIGFPKAREVLRPHGTIALFWNAHVPDTVDPRWNPIRQVYLDVVPELADLAPLTPDRADYDPMTELRASGCFVSCARRVFPFELSYTCDDFLALLDTYASHGALEPERRERLDDRLRAAIDGELAGRVTKPYEAVLVLGRT